MLLSTWGAEIPQQTKQCSISGSIRVEVHISQCRGSVVRQEDTDILWPVMENREPPPYCMIKWVAVQGTPGTSVVSIF